jgi:adenylate cyclase
MSDLTNYRRDLAILDPAGGRSSTDRNPQNNPASGSLSQVAPWMASNGANATTPASGNAMPTSFYNDSSDNLSSASALSPEFPPGFRNASTRPAQTPAASTDSPDAAYFPDDRRPSIASIATTASSQGSKASGARGGFRKLQGFFGEEFPGRDSSESSLTHPGTGKEHRSQSYGSRPHRDRNYSNATDHTRDASPSSSRPRTPVPAPEVVPFLYQEADVCLKSLSFVHFLDSTLHSAPLNCCRCSRWQRLTSECIFLSSLSYLLFHLSSYIPN